MLHRFVAGVFHQNSVQKLQRQIHHTPFGTRRHRRVVRLPSWLDPLRKQVFKNGQSGSPLARTAASLRGYTGSMRGERNIPESVNGLRDPKEINLASNVCSVSRSPLATDHPMSESSPALLLSSAPCSAAPHHLGHSRAGRGRSMHPPRRRMLSWPTHMHPALAAQSTIGPLEDPAKAQALRPLPPVLGCRQVYPSPPRTREEPPGNGSRSTKPFPRHLCSQSLGANVPKPSFP